MEGEKHGCVSSRRFSSCSASLDSVSPASEDSGEGLTVPVTSFGQLEAWYIDHQLVGYTRSQISSEFRIGDAIRVAYWLSWIASVQTFFTFCGSLFAGRWFDAHGTRLLVVIGLLLSTGAIIGMACAFA